jgi:hypothetical protein
VHGRLVNPVVTPRFVLTCTLELLKVPRQVRTAQHIHETRMYGHSQRLLLLRRPETVWDAHCNFSNVNWDRGLI